jgi:hypothetical protein
VLEHPGRDTEGAIFSAGAAYTQRLPKRGRVSRPLQDGPLKKALSGLVCRNRDHLEQLLGPYLGGLDEGRAVVGLESVRAAAVELLEDAANVVAEIDKALPAARRRDMADRRAAAGRLRVVEGEQERDAA